jgi:iron complex outermembrane receptor protein
MKSYLIIILIISPFLVKAQSTAKDTTALLAPVTVKGFETNRKLFETPASVNLINEKEIQRLNGTSLVAVVNTVPGVRMEERSPGSYRLSIRGSLLRSPFGIRNIKVYLDDLPFTDAGGNTYLNLIDPAALNNAEILKGPASNLYGAGTGGAVILNTQTATGFKTAAHNNMQLQLQGGSYGLLAQNFKWAHQNSKHSFVAAQSHLQSDGYRDNSRLRKDVLHFSSAHVLSKNDVLKAHLLLADLYYKTPGGLTFAQWQANPKQARPATPALPGAVQQKAAIYNKTIFAGLSNTLQLSKKWSNVSSAVFSYTDFKNPFITNYEKRNEASRGIRTKMIYDAVNTNSTAVKFIAGAEWQTTFANINNYGNRAGVADTVQSKDEVNAFQRFYFLQADVAINKKLFINAGASINQFTYRYVRTTDNPVKPEKTKNFTAVVSPRIAATYSITKNIAVRVIVSKGFSAPTIAEVRPSEGSFFESLQPEYGWNYEAGVRGGFLQNRLQYDINAYQFNLNNAIVRRTTNTGAEYFVNAGGTVQKGMELLLSYQLLEQKERFISNLKLGTSITLNNYRFKNYKVTTTDYSGNRVTGVPQNIIVNTVDVTIKTKLFLSAVYNYTNKLPLTDANSFYAGDYHLLQCKAVYKIIFKKLLLDVFAGADNIFNEQYSLGNDINAVGNRFYNAAPLRNYFGGLKIEL